MKKLFFLILFFVVFSGIKAQDDPIIYSIPRQIIEKLKGESALYRYHNDTVNLVALLDSDKQNHYHLSIIRYDSLDTKSRNLLDEILVKSTNRKLRLSEKEFIPIIMIQDILFADLGKEKDKNGKMIKRKIILPKAPYTIIFDWRGNIY